MEPEVNERFEKIEAILRETAEHRRQAEQRMDKAELRMDKADQRFEAVRKIHEQRLEATRKLVEGGINFVKRGQRETDAKLAAALASVDHLSKSLDAFVDSLKKGGNGTGRRQI